MSKFISNTINRDGDQLKQPRLKSSLELLNKGADK